MQPRAHSSEFVRKCYALVVLARRRSLLGVIGVSIRSLRSERGLSQETLAARADLDRSYVSGVERGVKNISVLNLERIANALDVSLVELLAAMDSTRRQHTNLPYSSDMSQISEEPWEPGRYLSLS